MQITVYHNPRCSKSRATLALLEQRGIEPEIVHYLDDPPGADRLRELARMLGIPPREMVRTGESVWAEMAEKIERIDDEKLLQLMAEHPVLIQRPIVVAGDRARIGRPPEKVLEIL